MTLIYEPKKEFLQKKCSCDSYILARKGVSTKKSVHVTHIYEPEKEFLLKKSVHVTHIYEPEKEFLLKKVFM